MIPSLSMYLDSRQTRPWCFVSHAHSDHIAIHDRALATPATSSLAEYRLGSQNVVELAYGESLALDAGAGGMARLHPAGHVLGSAMLHVQTSESSLLYTGDFKLRPCLTVEQADPPPADVLVMESTFGQPLYRFPPWEQVVNALVNRVGEALSQDRQPIVMGYTLGKAQEIVRILTGAGFTVTVHGAVYSICRLYEQFGVQLGSYRHYRAEDFHGSKALDLAERGVLVAPPNVARTGFVTRFNNPLRIMLSGWGMLKNASYRYGVDHVLPLSDHADFDELFELIERVRPKKIYTHHGFREFADTLRSRGLDACCARPDVQLSLFPD